MNWKPHTEHPDQMLSALIARTLPPDDEYVLMEDLYMWDGAVFREEKTWSALRLLEYWWLPESDVLKGLPA